MNTLFPEEMLREAICSQDELDEAREYGEAFDSTPTEQQVLKAVYESGLHQYSPSVLKTEWKDGIDVDVPSSALMNFARKLLA